MHSSPIYVTAQDKQNERTVCTVLAERLRCEFVELAATTAGADWIAVRAGAATALVEIKTRTTPYAQYSTYLIDQRKLDDLALAAGILGLKPILAVMFSDGIYVVDVTIRSSYPVKSGGRSDRGDKYDTDIVYHIPIGELTFMGERHA